MIYYDFLLLFFFGRSCILKTDCLILYRILKVKEGKLYDRNDICTGGHIASTRI